MPGPDAADAKDLALLRDAVCRAGQIAMSFFGGCFKSWDKARGQPVSEADLAVDRFLSETLRAERPDYGWLSEESADDPARLAAKRTFVVDPIDGTIAFLKAKPHFTICAAVVADGRTRAGVVFNPATEECYAAAEGGGATLNGQAICVSERAEIAGCRMLASRTLFEHPGWPTPWPEMTVESRSSIAYRMALVAGGIFDATLALTAKHDWDLAAADVIVREAGGRVSDHRGQALRYNGAKPILPSVVCAGPALHAKLIKRVGHVDLKRHQGTP